MTPANYGVHVEARRCNGTGHTLLRLGPYTQVRHADSDATRLNAQMEEKADTVVPGFTVRAVSAPFEPPGLPRPVHGRRRRPHGTGTTDPDDHVREEGEQPMRTLTGLHRTRYRMLSVAYGNTDHRYQLYASWADQTLAALARHSADEAERLAARCFQPDYVGTTEDRALQEAAAAGITTEGSAPTPRRHAP
ncbi:hypothetical protein [Streptomyces sp. NBC_00057]|uniref:hypothetical protein n=1 Tax=Streptomyces sp. NBC_00057 TaxID=2975634 RepID=UPI00324BAE42